MRYFTKEEFLAQYSDECECYPITNSNIDSACLMIFSQIGLKHRDYSWDEKTVPEPIKNASMEQLRFLLIHDIPFLDTNEFKVDGMEAKLDSVISKKALLFLSTASVNYLYRGSTNSQNMAINIPFGS